MKNSYFIIIVLLSLFCCLRCGAQVNTNEPKPSKSSMDEGSSKIDRPYERYWFVGEVKDSSGSIDPAINLYKDELLVNRTHAQGGEFRMELTKWQSIDFTHILFATYGHYRVAIPRDSMDFSNDTVFFNVLLQRLPPELDTLEKVNIFHEIHKKPPPKKVE